VQPAGKRYIVYQSKSTVIRYWQLADLHIGNRGCAMQRLQADLNEIRDDPYAFWVGIGDLAEYISPKDKRFDPAVIDPRIFETPFGLGDIGAVLRDKLLELLDPIKHKCLGIGFGNHEAKYMKEENQLRLHQTLCDQLRVPDHGYSAWFRVSFVHNNRYKQPRLFRNTPKPILGSSFTLDHYTHHGAGRATTPGGRLNRLLQFMNFVDAHLYSIGHVHDEVQKKAIRLTGNADGTEIVETVRLGVVTGSYLRTYNKGSLPGYGEARGYPPSCLGAVKFEIKPWYRQVETRLGMTVA